MSIITDIAEEFSVAESPSPSSSSLQPGANGSRTDSSAKAYFSEFFKDKKSVEVVGKNERHAMKHSAVCKLCKKSKEINGADTYTNFRTHIVKGHKNSEEYKLFRFNHAAPVLIATRTLDGYVTNPTAKPYAKDHPCQLRLFKNIAYCQFQTVIPPAALTNKCFDVLIRDIDPKLREPASCRALGELLVSSNDDWYRQPYFGGLRLDPLSSCWTRSHELYTAMNLLTEWPSNQTLARNIIPMYEKEIRMKLCKQLFEADAVALNADIWTNKLMRGYLGLSVHFVDKKFRIRNYLLACPRFSGTHVATSIFQLAIEVLEEFSIPKKVFFIGTDNGANIVNAFKEWMPGFQEAFLEDSDEDKETCSDDLPVEDEIWNSPYSEDLLDDQLLVKDLNKKLQTYCYLPKRKLLVRCVAHTLQLILGDATKKCEPLQKAIEKLAKIVSKVRKSCIMSEIVEKEFGKAFLRRCVTQWNGNFLSVKRALKFSWQTSGLKPDCRLSEGSQEILREFVGLTKPFEVAFKALQRADRPAISDVIPLIYGLRAKLDAYIKGTGELQDYAINLLSGLNKRLGGAEADELYMIATFLDPKYKLRWCRGAANYVVKAEQVRELMLTRLTAVKIEASKKKLSVSASFKLPEMLSFMEDSMEEEAGSCVIDTDFEGELSAEAEFQRYLDDGQKYDNPLDFYKLPTNQARFKRCCALARQVFCATATTAGIERIFSISGLLLSDKRQRTTDDTFNRMLFCSINRDFLETEPKKSSFTLMETE